MSGAQTGYGGWPEIMASPSRADQWARGPEFLMAYQAPPEGDAVT